MNIAFISSKVCRNTGIIGKLKYHLPIFALKTLYDSLILPHLHYGILAWGHQADRPLKLQKRAIHIITFSKFLVLTEPLFKIVGTLWLPEIYKQKTLKFYYEFVNNNLPLFFQSFIVQPRSAVHRYNTPQRNKFCTNKTKQKFADNIICNVIITTVNSTPANIIEKIWTHSLDGFSNYIKTMCLQAYSLECSITECHVCSNS